MNATSFAINWPIQGEPALSSKDMLGATLKLAEVFA